MAYDASGAPIPGDWMIVNRPYFEHMLKDLDACYGEVK